MRFLISLGMKLNTKLFQKKKIVRTLALILLAAFIVLLLARIFVPKNNIDRIVEIHDRAVANFQSFEENFSFFDIEQSKQAVASLEQGLQSDYEELVAMEVTENELLVYTQALGLLEYMRRVPSEHHALIIDLFAGVDEDNISEVLLETAQISEEYGARLSELNTKYRVALRLIQE